MRWIILLTGNMMISFNNSGDMVLPGNSSLHPRAMEIYCCYPPSTLPDPSGKARHDRMVSLVTQMPDLNRKVQDAKIDHEKTLFQRQIEATDAAIDKLVYELYGLTPEEIAIVEGTNTNDEKDTPNN